MSDRNDLIEIFGTQNPDRRGDVIFVHGLGGDARGTWHPKERRDDNNFWPAWLGQDLSDVGIWSLAYEVEPFRWKGNSMPLVDRATNSLDLLDSYEIGDRPIIFVTHSMGGLLVKQMLRSARDFGKWQAIASGTRGIVFLSTPHSGSDLASWINYIGTILQTTVSVDELKAHDPNLRNLNLWYRNDHQFSEIPMLVYCETRPTNGILVVNQTSADPGIKGVIPVPMDVDHISICKVENKNNQIYRQVKRFVNQNLTTPLPPIQPNATEADRIFRESVINQSMNKVKGNVGYIESDHPQKILILSAIAHGLRLDQEIRKIEDAIRRAVRREFFEIRVRTAVRSVDIRRAIAEEKPQIVHFCGHGLKDGSLLLEDDGGQDKPVNPKGLGALFNLHADYVNCVLLNFCHSQKPAEVISQYINYAIGMNQTIEDKAAIAFAQGFYDALGYNNNGNQDLLVRAFEEGLVAVQMENISEGDKPVLKIKFQGSKEEDEKKS